ncbi:MAG: hypothetical protein Q9194_007530 [Teloschistes cf. exilis]
MDDSIKRFLGPPQMLRPSEISDQEWQDRRTLPSVHTVGNCNIAILSILRLDRQYTYAVASFAQVSQKELLPSLGGGKTVFHDCIVKYGYGGYRQVPGSPGLITVMYADGSVFERFLLSGAGSAHYDAAVENPDGTFTTFWLQHKLSRPLGAEGADVRNEG